MRVLTIPNIFQMLHRGKTMGLRLSQMYASKMSFSRGGPNHKLTICYRRTSPILEKKAFLMKIRNILPVGRQHVKEPILRSFDSLRLLNNDVSSGY